MKVIVDYDRCESNAACFDECPEVFALDDEDKPVVLCEHPAEDLLDKLKLAATCCPRSAIVLLDEPGDVDAAKAPQKHSV